MNLPSDVTIGLELTFIPRKANAKGLHEMTKREAISAANRLWRALRPVNIKLAPLLTHFVPKVEPFRRNDAGEFKSFIVEVTNGHYPPTIELFESYTFRALVGQVFAKARSVGLVPRIIKKTKEGDLYFGTGGCHAHLGIANLFRPASFLTNLASFEKHLFVDYANRPYIRWLFGEWFDADINAVVGWTPGDSVAVEDVHCAGVNHQHAIYPRFSGTTAKTILPTYEFRIFDEMVENERELTLLVRFLDAWMSDLRVKVISGTAPVVAINEEVFNRLRNLRHAWSEISRFLRDLNLNPHAYRPWFDRCYVPRVRYGKMT